MQQVPVRSDERAEIVFLYNGFRVQEGTILGIRLDLPESWFHTLAGGETAGAVGFLLWQPGWTPHAALGMVFKRLGTHYLPTIPTPIINIWVPLYVVFR